MPWSSWPSSGLFLGSLAIHQAILILKPAYPPTLLGVWDTTWQLLPSKAARQYQSADLTTPQPCTSYPPRLSSNATPCKPNNPKPVPPPPKNLFKTEGKGGCPTKPLPVKKHPGRHLGRNGEWGGEPELIKHVKLSFLLGSRGPRTSKKPH